MIVNMFFANKFYIIEKRQILNKVYNQINNVELDELFNVIEKIENENLSTIVYTKNTKNINQINDELIYKLEKKKIKLNKFWITDDVLKEIESSSVNKIYDQEFVKYKFYAKILKKEDYIFVIGLVLSNIDEIINIINKFIILIIIFSIILNWIIVKINSYMIIRPIKNIKSLSKDIAKLNFRTENIKTRDEIEDLANSINKMSKSLEEAHRELSNQNLKLKDLMCSVAHELKTPLSIIKVYVQGIEDGFDDGTYLDIIHNEIHKIDVFIENLLTWFKIGRDEIQKQEVDLLKILESCLSKYKLIFEEKNIKFDFEVNKEFDYFVLVREDHINMVFENLITNAVKYSNNKFIKICLTMHLDVIKFKIMNSVDKKIDDLDKIWIPFYVLEKSRDKNFSGTGLGLSIVKDILEKYKFEFGVNCTEDIFEFYIEF